MSSDNNVICNGVSMTPEQFLRQQLADDKPLARPKTYTKDSAAQVKKIALRRSYAIAVGFTSTNKASNVHAVRLRRLYSTQGRLVGHEHKVSAICGVDLIDVQPLRSFDGYNETEAKPRGMCPRCLAILSGKTSVETRIEME